MSCFLPCTSKDTPTRPACTMSSRLRNAAGGLGNTVPMYGSVARKAFLAKQRGAKALVVVDAPVTKAGTPPPEEAPFPALESSGYGDAGIPMVVLKREHGQKIIAALDRRRPVAAAPSD